MVKKSPHLGINENSLPSLKKKKKITYRTKKCSKHQEKIRSKPNLGTSIVVKPLKTKDNMLANFVKDFHFCDIYYLFFYHYYLNVSFIKAAASPGPRIVLDI